MIMLTLYFRKQVPFHTVYVHGLVRDKNGQKMSKSKGNVIDPIDLIDGIGLDALVEKRTSGLMNPKIAPKIEKNTRKDYPEGFAAYGTDALRYTYYSLASTGRDINFDVGRIEGFRNFCNKLWNASNYVLMNMEQLDNTAPAELSLADRWIISRLQEAEQAATQGMDTYRLDLASQAIYDFIWKDYCDWYLELTKPVLWDDNAAPSVKQGTRQTLIRVLEATLRMAHPLMPFITEEIWQKVKPLVAAESDTIMLADYPVADPNKIDAQALTDIEWIKNVVTGIRNIRGEMNISPSKQIAVIFKNSTANDQRCIEANTAFLKKLASLESVSLLNKGEEAPLSATAICGELEILVPMAGLIDKNAEIARLQKESEKLQKEVSRLQGKLQNPKFVDKAPQNVVEKEKDKLRDAESALGKLNLQQQRIAEL